MKIRLSWAACAALGMIASSCGGGGGEAQSPPTITEVTTSSNTVDEGGAITVEVAAEGKGLSYEWSADSGTFDDPTMATTGWASDIVSTTSHDPVLQGVDINVTVRNAAGEVTDSVDVDVRNLNEPPEVETAAAASVAQLLAGTDVELSVSGTDSEGDTLSYEWTQDPATPAGTFDDPNKATAIWTAPAVSADTEFTFEVAITDPGSGKVVDTATTTAQVPSWTNDIFPIFSETMFDGMTAGGCGACHEGGSGTFTWDQTDDDTAHAAIVEVGASGNCASVGDYITPGDPATSAIFQKISAGAGDCNGGQMPANEDGYFNDNPGERTMIESWILAGAVDDT